MSIIGWLVIGGVAGWLASLIMGTSERQGCITNILLGIVGALVGGLVWGMISGDDFVAEFSVGTLLVATLGAVIILAIYRALTGRPT
jgi:uncharacterized membrane protein YeaQ/YmgE (transglycosylase-associated protein family)